jgi:hypothetical protein
MQAQAMLRHTAGKAPGALIELAPGKAALAKDDAFRFGNGSRYRLL